MFSIGEHLLQHRGQLVQPIPSGRGNPSVGRLLISHITLRGPDLRQTYARIVAHNEVNLETLHCEVALDTNVQNQFGLEDAILRETINFLLITRLIEQRGESRRKASFRATPLLDGVEFPLLLLHHIMTLTDARQRAPILIHRQLISDDILSFTPASIREHMERSQYRDLFTWTSEKTTFWSHLAAYLGLARRLEREGRYLLIPQLSLMLAAIRYEMRQAQIFPLALLLDALEENFFACYTRQRRIHRGLEQTLIALNHLGHIRLSHESDTPRSFTLANHRVSHIQLIHRQEDGQ